MHFPVHNSLSVIRSHLHLPIAVMHTCSSRDVRPPLAQHLLRKLSKGSCCYSLICSYLGLNADSDLSERVAKYKALSTDGYCD